MSDFVKYVVKLLGKGCPLWASVRKDHGNEVAVRYGCPLGTRHFVISFPASNL